MAVSVHGNPQGSGTPNCLDTHPHPRWNPQFSEDERHLVMGQSSLLRRLEEDLSNWKFSETLRTTSEQIATSRLRHQLGDSLVVTRGAPRSYDQQQVMHWDDRWGMVAGTGNRDSAHISTANAVWQATLSSDFVRAQRPAGNGLRAGERTCSPADLAAIRTPHIQELRSACSILVSWSAAQQGTPQGRGWRELTRQILTRIMLESVQINPAGDSSDQAICADQTPTALDLSQLWNELKRWTPEPRTARLGTVNKQAGRWIGQLISQRLISDLEAHSP